MSRNFSKKHSSPVTKRPLRRQTHVRTKKGGTPTDFEELYKRYFKAVFGYLTVLTGSRDLAQELTQEVFFRVLKKPGSFRGESSVETWLCAIGRNLYTDELRRRSRSAPLPVECASDEDIERQLETADTAHSLRKKLHTLSEPYKEVFMLRAMGELSFREIGALFGKGDSWARVIYFRARQKLTEEEKTDE